MNVKNEILRLPKEYLLIVDLFENGENFKNVLSHKLKTSYPYTSLIVKRLIEQGIIEIKEVIASRQMLVLTDKGFKIAAHAKAIVKELELINK